MKTKNEIRKEVITILERMSVKRYEERSLNLTNQLINHSFFQKARVIAVTLSRFPEVSTKKIIEIAHSENKTIVIPETIYPERVMQFRYYQPGDKLIKKKFDLQEPSPTSLLASPEAIDLMIVPGAAYIKTGYRIGFGGGFYDKYLANFKGKTLSLLFSEQLVSTFTIEEHDIPVDQLLIAK